MAAQIGAPAAAMRAHQELIRYWAGLRRGDRLPARRDIQPEGFKRLLPTVSLIERPREAKDYRLRLAGTGLYTVYGGEITGRTLSDVFSHSAAAYWRTELDAVVASRRPSVGCHNLGWRGAAHMSLLWLRLPLASNGVDVDMILGYDAPVGSPAEMSGIRAA